MTDAGSPDERDPAVPPVEPDSERPGAAEAPVTDDTTTFEATTRFETPAASAAAGQPDAPQPGYGNAATSEPAVAPGWYPVQGGQRYWDGTQWTDNVAPAPAANPSDERLWATLAHAGPIVVGFWAPLIIYLVKKDESAFIRFHAAEALNFSITVMIAMVVSAILIIVLVGLVLMVVVSVLAFVFAIIASIAANKGEWYRYPINIRLVS